ncbi:uncharacterized protein LOC119432979 isoform X2 [Dermacentor silvarum]|uniref:uncharacterized protein LOC119432979 isoform X2 n=1 Tax=Dermacentor silvarum TaxID=543639 RepID=UPI002100D016|nr:uncharacterized protein LOC119432979 isoform X2 [Dermacentor silvarum]
MEHLLLLPAASRHAGDVPRCGRRVRHHLQRRGRLDERLHLQPGIHAVARGDRTVPDRAAEGFVHRRRSAGRRGPDNVLLLGQPRPYGASDRNLLRPPWMSPSDPMPSIHRPEGADDRPAAELEQGPKGGASEKPDASKMSVAGEDPSTAGNNPAPVSGGASGAASVDPGMAAQAEGMEPHPDGDQPAAVPEGQANAGQQPEGTAAEPPKVMSPTGVVGATVDGTVAKTLAAHSALTSLSVTAGALIYDYAMDGDPVRAPSATLALVSYGAGDLVGRMCYETLLSSGDHRKVMAVQAFLQGGVLFLMAMTNEVFLLAPVGFGLGGISSTLDLLPVPVLQRFIEPDAVERQLGICRAASGIGCLLGPVFVMVFRDGEMQSYAVVFILSGLLSIIAGVLWLPGIKKEMDEARGKTTPYPKTELVVAEPGAGEPGAGEPGAAEPGAAELSPPLPGALEPAAGEPIPGEPGSPPDAAIPGAQMPAANPGAMA